MREWKKWSYSWSQKPEQWDVASKYTDIYSILNTLVWASWISESFTRKVRTELNVLSQGTKKYYYFIDSIHALHVGWLTRGEVEVSDGGRESLVSNTEDKIYFVDIYRVVCKRNSWIQLWFLDARPSYTSFNYINIYPMWSGMLLTERGDCYSNRRPSGRQQLVYQLERHTDYCMWALTIYIVFREGQEGVHYSVSNNHNSWASHRRFSIRAKAPIGIPAVKLCICLFGRYY